MAHRMTLLLLVVLTVNAQACEREEYARLKDSTRKELTDSYCDAQLMAETQQTIADANSQAFKDFTAVGDTRRAENARRDRLAATATKQTCQRVARDAADMLSKKFGQKSVACKK